MIKGNDPSDFERGFSIGFKVRKTAQLAGFPIGTVTKVTFTFTADL